METPAATGSASRRFGRTACITEANITLIDLMNQLRYESGEATIKPEGYEVLDQLIEHLKGAPANQLIRVEGHADNTEIGPSLKSRYPTNWDLSKARASGVLRYLVEKGGIDSARISSIGFGDTKPVVSNATEPGRQKNRRVDIVLYKPQAEGLPSEQMKTPAPIQPPLADRGTAPVAKPLIDEARQQGSSPVTSVDQPGDQKSNQPLFPQP